MLELRGDAARVHVELWPAHVEGWVATSALRGSPPEGGLSNVFGYGGLGALQARPRGRCAGDVPLFIRRGGEARVVGRLLRGAAAAPVRPAGALVDVTLPALDGTLLDGWSWAVRAGDAACLSGS